MTAHAKDEYHNYHTTKETASNSSTDGNPSAKTNSIADAVAFPLDHGTSRCCSSCSSPNPAASVAAVILCSDASSGGSSVDDTTVGLVASSDVEQGESISFDSAPARRTRRTKKSSALRLPILKAAMPRCFRKSSSMEKQQQGTASQGQHDSTVFFGRGDVNAEQQQQEQPQQEQPHQQPQFQQSQESHETTSASTESNRAVISSCLVEIPQQQLKSILKKDPDHSQQDDIQNTGSSRLNSKTARNGKPATSVHFQKLQIRTFPQILGDHPCCSRGLPLSLGWDYTSEYVVSVDEYEASRVRMPRKNLRLDEFQRREILKNVQSPVKINHTGGDGMIHDYEFMDCHDDGGGYIEYDGVGWKDKEGLLSSDNKPLRKVPTVSRHLSSSLSSSSSLPCPTQQHCNTPSLICTMTSPEPKNQNKPTSSMVGEDVDVDVDGMMDARIPHISAVSRKSMYSEAELRRAERRMYRERERRRKRKVVNQFFDTGVAVNTIPAVSGVWNAQ